MKRILKWTGITLAAVLLVGLIWGFLAHEPLPSGKSGAGADALAEKMLDALNHERYDETRFLHWSYRNGANRYEWDKEMGICLVRWDNYEVQLILSNPQNSKVKMDGAAVLGKEKKEIVQKAVDMFNNDSFWLVAPYKVFDDGANRSLITMENGSEALLVTYTSGGSTPGDSYLWLLAENGTPYAFKMWVKILPIGGVQASWDEWTTTKSGAYLPKSHKLGPLDLSMGNVKGFNP